MRSECVLVRCEDGKFVAVPGADKSYTDRLQEARVFKTLGEALAEVCPLSEDVRYLDEFLNVSQ